MEQLDQPKLSRMRIWEKFGATFGSCLIESPAQRLPEWPSKTMTPASTESKAKAEEQKRTLIIGL